MLSGVGATRARTQSHKWTIWRKHHLLTNLRFIVHFLLQDSGRHWRSEPLKDSSGELHVAIKRPHWSVKLWPIGESDATGNDGRYNVDVTGWNDDDDDHGDHGLNSILESTCACLPTQTMVSDYYCIFIIDLTKSLTTPVTSKNLNPTWALVQNPNLGKARYGWTVNIVIDI